MEEGARGKLVVAATPVILIGLAMLIGCVGDDNTPRRTTPPFSHKHHVVEEEIKCTVCHKDAEKGDKAGMPTFKTCTKCHEGTDEKKTPNELQIRPFFKDEKQPAFTNLTALSAETKFSHKLHAEAKVQCASCHKGMENSKVVTSAVRVTMRNCIACHTQVGVGKGVKDNCALCHTNISRQWKPPSHQQNWKELHGRAAGFAGRNSTQNCELCHTEKTCIQCHRVEQPKNHTNYWRQRGHGATADLDRSGCRVCHSEDFCTRCHQSVAPQSHRANWDTRHCVGCHLPLKGNSCAVCHKGTPSHNAAPVLPANSVHKKATSSDCRTCHFGLKMRHLDNGDDCLLCHRRQ